MMLVYLTITVICYHYKGDTLPPFLPDVRLGVTGTWVGRRDCWGLLPFDCYTRRRGKEGWVGVGLGWVGLGGGWVEGGLG